MTSKGPARNKTKAGERQTNNNKNPSRKPNHQVGCAEQGRRAPAVALPEINTGYLDVCFGFQGVVDLKWMVGEERGGH